MVAPKVVGISLISYQADFRTGGTYRLAMAHPSSGQPMAFFGRYIEGTPYSRLVWTNEESGDGGAVTTVTFEDKGAATLVTIHELYPSKDALDEAMPSGAASGWDEQFKQLEEMLGTLSGKTEA